jgi:hypothetical protein
MIEIRYGSVVVTLPAELLFLENAGRLDATAVSRIAKAPTWVGAACLQAADSLEKAAGKITVPPELTPEVLRTFGMQALKVDQVIEDLESVLRDLKQNSLLYKSAGYQRLRQLNNYIKAQGKLDPRCYSLFKIVRGFFEKLSNRGALLTEEPSPETPETPASDNAD